jgi:hypothetical protein
VLFTAKMILPPRWQPDLHIKNTGTSAVVIVFKERASTTPPGEAWHNRFRAGDTLTVRAGQAPDAPAHTITLPARNPKPWTLNPVMQRWTAEVNADDPKNIRFENRFFTEVSIPPSPLEPWP